MHVSLSLSVGMRTSLFMGVGGQEPRTEKRPLVSSFLSGLCYAKLSACPTSLTYLLGCDFIRISLC